MDVCFGLTEHRRGSQDDKLDVSPSFIMIAFSVDSINNPGIGFPSLMDGCTIAGRALNSTTFHHSYVINQNIETYLTFQ
jgi:hypothetical protein